MILWTGISGLIVLMLGVIGYLVKTGFDGLRAELNKIWDKLEDNSKENAEIKKEHADLKAEVKAIDERCKERGNHCSNGHHHRRDTDEDN
jgi:predicted nuclease with TOPRIM domain